MTLLLVYIIAAAQAGVHGPWLDDDPIGFDTGTPGLGYADPPACGEYSSRHSKQLPILEDLYERANPINQWGEPYMVDLLTYTADVMAIQMPDADRMLIGDISSRYGGPLLPHKTHREGRDADVGIYLRGHTQGTTRTGFQHATPATLDYEATWFEIKTMLDTGRIEYMLLDQKLIDALRVWLLENDLATRTEVDNIFPPRDTPQIWEREGYLWHAPLHDDHLHVRVKCQ
jgi:hypothetical protein